MMKILKKIGMAYFEAMMKYNWVACPSGMIPMNYNRN
uniref:Uncharacterized protein n=1 Tax=Phage sp. ctL4h4 TaxID=2828005 RepID=A0A8S5TFF7_9VIRU|nr:MAG TPA: hypothetical protein [Phage sp. ctL4h4]